MKRSWFYRNGLSLTFLSLLVVAIISQFFTGMNVKNDELKEENKPELTAKGYIVSGHFIQATFENWESEFLQMGLYVILTIFLRQQGSSESKSLDKQDPVDREPKAHPKAPWAVKKGGIWLKIYKNSLSLAFIILFVVSFSLHFYGSRKDYNEVQIEKGKPTETAIEFISNPKFWFESLQNWQSEFLAVASILLLSIWLRQKGSPESKPVDTANEETV